MNSATNLVLSIVCILVATISAQSDTLTPINHTSLSQLDHASLKQIPIGLPITITNIELEDNLNVNLQLERFELLTQDAKVIVVKSDGQTESINPSVVLLRGTVIGDDDSQVFIGVSHNGTQGFVQHNNMLHFISTGPYRKKFQPVLALQIANAANLPAPASPKDFCQTKFDNELLFRFSKPIPVEGGAITGNPPCREVDIAIDTDWEFTGNLFAGDTTASAEYALFLMAAISEIYHRDLNTRLYVSFLRVWSKNNDPYNANGSLLNQLRDHWIANHGDVERELVHLFSGVTIGGGVAAGLGLVCSYDNGYCVSGNLVGSFPYPLEDNNNDNWDPIVVAHEMGHLFGSLHTHDYNPPVDSCFFGECKNADQGTLMSYCHFCPGGLANFQLRFHPIVIATILSYLDTVPCDISSEHCCVWDLDESGSVDTSDLLALFALWGTNPNGPPDFDGDGIVNTVDLLILFANWGPCE
ncbi:MAG: hypothetical protein IH984_08405 [Planctomycetes bacterium]|nr:hypothetical protein [Planctomycetota bacterium]